MRRWIVGETSLLLIGAVYKLWGRWWIDDDTCRRWVTAIMRAAIAVRRRPTRGTGGGEG
jgi:hypothetical protein